MVNIFKLVFLFTQFIASSLVNSEEMTFYLQEHSAEETIVGSLMSQLPESLKGKRLLVNFQHFASNTNADHSSLFTISPNDLTIRVKNSKELDREEICPTLRESNEDCILSFMISVRDEAVTHLMKLRIILRDINDYSPEFVDNAINAYSNNECKIITIAEDSKINSRFQLPKPIDRDSPSFGSPTVSLVKRDQDPFKLLIDAEGIWLQQTALLDYETTPSYNLTLNACDIGVPPLCCSLNICIDLVDVNDNRPTFILYNQTISVNENLIVGSSIGKFYALDRDKTNVINYKIISFKQFGNVKRLHKNDKSQFHLNEQTGELILARKLTGGVWYQIIIEASDQADSLKAHKTRNSVTIIVNDVNDNAPKLELTTIDSLVRMEKLLIEEQMHYIFYLFENNQEKIDLSFITVTDDDFGNNSECSCQLLSADGGPRTTHNQMVHLSSENKLTDGKFIYRLFINDTFDVEGMPINFRIKTKHLLDERVAQLIQTYQPFEKTEMSRLLCSDSGDEKVLSTEVFVYLVVLDENEYPTYFAEVNYHLEVSEKANLGQSLLRFKLHDQDFSDGHRVGYVEIQLEDEAANYFFVDQKTHDLTLIRNFDAELVEEFSFKVFAVNHGLNNVTHKTEALVNLKILDENDNRPKFLTQQDAFEVVENCENNKIVGKLLAEDYDISEENNKIIYKLIKCFGINNNNNSSNMTRSLIKDCPFSVDPKNGLIRVKGKIDREKYDQVELDVKASDNARLNTLSTLGNFKIKILDQNDNAPEWKMDKTPFNSSDQSFEFGADLPFDKPILQLIASDKDAMDNGKITYKLVTAIDQTSSESFTDFFRVDNQSGIVFRSDLADTRGKLKPGIILHCSFTAKDQGKPPKSSNYNLKLNIKSGSESNLYNGESIYLKNPQSDQEQLFSKDLIKYQSHQRNGLRKVVFPNLNNFFGNNNKTIFPLFIFIVVPLAITMGLIFFILLLLVVVRKRRKRSLRNDGIQLGPYKRRSSDASDLNFQCGHKQSPLLNPASPVYFSETSNINKSSETSTFRDFDTKVDESQTLLYQTDQTWNMGHNQEDKRDYYEIFNPVNANCELVDSNFTGYLISLLPVNSDEPRIFNNAK